MTKSVFTPRYKQFLKMLIDARKNADLTQAEVAKRIGWTQTKLSKVERGIRRLDVVEFLQFADAIGFDPIEMIAKLQRI